MTKQIKSRSDTQTRIEKEIFKKLMLQAGDIELDSKIKLSFDGIKDANGKTCLYEIYCGMDKLNPGHRRKIANDILKMVFYEKFKEMEFNKKLIVVDEKIKDLLNSQNHSTWLNLAIKEFAIEVEYVKIDEELENELIKARKDQSKPHNKE